MHLWTDELDSPVGRLRLVVSPASGALHVLEFGPFRPRDRAALAARFGAVELVAQADPAGHANRLRAWFAGDMHALDDIAVDAWGTPFQQRVWRALRALRPGETTSYGAIASAIGAPQAARAVGTANGRNPVAIVVPCHRVIGADGALTGYGGGLERKRWLLAHERAHAGRQAGLFAATA